VLVVIGIGSSAAVGFTDRGTIDVNQVITERNERVQSSGSGESIIPEQNVNQRPDGGLIGGYGASGRSPVSAPTPEPEEDMSTSTATSTATTTATSTATSTEETVPEPSVPMTATEAAAASEQATSTDS
jgi:hypothetical protein